MSAEPSQRQVVETALVEQISALLGASRDVTAAGAASFHPELRATGFFVAHWLFSHGPAKPSAVADGLGWGTLTTGDLILKMKKLGLIASEPDPGNRRGLVVALTAEGESRVRAVLAAHDSWVLDRTATWTEPELRDLLGRLAHFNGTD
ncbi:winged helix-turn-helix transcriptional regulator [Microbacteriaceae bacterium VKM Ac-2854]|nr:winged helix-turn-helix transcriptional regulator [Microbacteriaceae bacterium VKM Ac-2854]